MSNTTKPTPTSLSNSQQTLLITLYGRHLDSLSPHPILADPFSSLVIQRINYDFPTLAAGNGTQVVVSTRSRHFDERISSFLAHCKEKGDDVTVVQLGCGLDTRSHRVQWGGQGVRWIDVDLPEVIALRRAAMPDLPPAPDGKKREYSTVSGSATEEGLIKGLPNDGVTLVVMEGLAAYLDPDEGRRMVGVVCEHFGKRGGEVLVDTAGRLTGWISGVFGYIWRVKGRVGLELRPKRDVEE
ncbi:S-adenosyl-L-methionine-dependent methyltransferase [Podospora aff. communis PSN243]|uniref:S-adenosyl-L-methionine-dependent methyltransferase n=1 Tax=Podospora aff. communis PSN243 TaxID=3040156 RepID=A0AAV9GPM5_9PEZI|nr:S-adenosyl-L-methionine-dependent methyltransferase [Podospora aff. communis PSN243]